ncbi:MAG TPA: peptidoglycan DD-metalloendopeptidase family protein [Casimicrobiaceae bacterium]|nr:peptidoglycan DD-metalloendopeptidase family protein [Casimicrobiaceae bacterium]
MRLFPPSALSNPVVRVAVAVACVAVLLAGCATRRPVPVEDRTMAGTQAPVVVVPPAGSPATPAAAQPAPVPTYTVKRGDTLHQIALDAGLDYRELAAWNNIENVNVIRVGQVLRLIAPGETAPVAQDPVAAGAGGVVTTPLRTASPIIESGSGAASAPSSAPGAPAAAGTSGIAAQSAARSSDASLKTGPKAIKEPYSDQAVRELTLAASAVPAPTEKLAMAQPGGVRSEPAPAPKGDAKAEPSPAASTPSAAPSPATSGDPDRLDWAWPTKGKIIAGFSDTANLKGIDIAGTAGQAIHASAPGRVVYAGNGLRGYGKLIIIKHNATYLSAYAHNREILVKEGQQVTRGQKIAEMGNTDADQVKLHFEIRRQGKPMDPAKYLPPA